MSYLFTIVVLLVAINLILDEISRSVKYVNDTLKNGGGSQ